MDREIREYHRNFNSFQRAQRSYDAMLPDDYYHDYEEYVEEDTEMEEEDD